MWRHKQLQSQQCPNPTAHLEDMCQCLWHQPRPVWCALHGEGLACISYAICHHHSRHLALLQQVVHLQQRTWGSAFNHAIDQLQVARYGAHTVPGVNCSESLQFALLLLLPLEWC